MAVIVSGQNVINAKMYDSVLDVSGSFDSTGIKKITILNTSFTQMFQGTPGTSGYHVLAITQPTIQGKDLLYPGEGYKEYINLGGGGLFDYIMPDWGLHLVFGIPFDITGLYNQTTVQAYQGQGLLPVPLTSVQVVVDVYWYYPSSSSRQGPILTKKVNLHGSA